MFVIFPAVEFTNDDFLKLMMQSRSQKVRVNENGSGKRCEDRDWIEIQCDDEGKVIRQASNPSSRFDQQQQTAVAVLFLGMRNPHHYENGESTFSLILLLLHYLD